MDESHPSNEMHCSVCGSPSVTVTQEMVKPITTASKKIGYFVLAVVVWLLLSFLLMNLGLFTILTSWIVVFIAIAVYWKLAYPKAQEVTVVRCSTCGKAHVTTPLPENCKAWNIAEKAA